MAIKLKSTKGIGVNCVKTLVYGGAGVGKTVLCSTSPNPIIISAERGLLSLSSLNLPFINVDSMADIDEAYKYCINSEYNTICIDSISELTETLLLGIKKQMISESRSGKIDARQAYGKMAETTLAMIRNFRDIPDKNVIFTCKMKRVEDEDSGVIQFEPSMPGRILPNNISYMFDEVFCMKIDRKGNRILQTAGDRKHDCKDRSGKLDKEINVVASEPTMTNIYNTIRGIK